MIKLLGGLMPLWTALKEVVLTFSLSPWALLAQSLRR